MLERAALKIKWMYNGERAREHRFMASFCVLGGKGGDFYHKVYFWTFKGKQQAEVKIVSMNSVSWFISDCGITK